MVCIGIMVCSSSKCAPCMYRIHNIFIIVEPLNVIYPIANKCLNIDLSAIIENTINNSMAFINGIEFNAERNYGFTIKMRYMVGSATGNIKSCHIF